MKTKKRPNGHRSSNLDIHTTKQQVNDFHLSKRDEKKEYLAIRRVYRETIGLLAKKQ